MAWTDEIRDRCRDWCACCGEPPCFAADPDATPCDDCLAGRENPDWNAPAQVAEPINE